MSKLQKIIKECESGKRKDTYDLDITLEEYLAKDAKGMTFLEYLLKSEISIKYSDEQKFTKSVEIAYLYLKYNKPIYIFDLEEIDLFSYINGEKFIDILAKSNELNQKMISVISEHIEIIDILIESKNYYLLEHLNDNILKKLMIPDSNGVYPIEKYFDNERVINKLIYLIKDPQKLIYFCNKKNRVDLLKEANGNVLLYKIDQNKTLLQYLLSKNIIPSELRTIPDNINFVNYLRSNNMYEFLMKAGNSVLLLEVESNKTLLEDLIEKGYTSKLSIYLSNIEMLKILNKYNRLDLIESSNEKILLMPAKDIFNKSLDQQTVLEYMLDQGHNPLSKIYTIMDKDVIKILYSRGYYEFLGSKIYENNLLNIMEDGSSVLDKILENNLNIEFKGSGFESIVIAKKLYEKNRIDLLSKGKVQVLLNNINENYIYFDFVLEAIKNKKIKCDLNKYSFFGCSINDIANFYLAIAKQDMIEYIIELTEEKLLEEYNGKRLIDELLDINSELALNKVIPENVKSNMKIAIILKSRGFVQKDYDIPVQESNFSHDYLQEFNNSLGIGPLMEEGEFLLKKLENLFLNDGKSDPDLVSSLISGYRNALLVNYKFNIQELRNLVMIKENNIEKFVYQRIEKGAHFNPITGKVNSKNSNVSTILHETGHALHSYLANKNVPKEYIEVIERVRLNPETLKRVEDYSNEYHNIKEKIKIMVDEKYKTFFEIYFDLEKKQQIDEFIKKSQDEKKIEFEGLGIPDYILDAILSNLFITEEYIKHQKRIFINEYTESIMRSEFGAFMAIGDILDAIYEGELHSGVLKNEIGDKIKPTSGHGISYYFDNKHGFDEMIANFSTIVKSNDSVQMLKLLKDLVGEELYNMLSNYYYNYIVVSNQNGLEDMKSL